MDEFNILKICLDTYDENVRPRSLSCDDSVCTSCLKSFIKEKTPVCPHCQESPPASSVDDIPINHDVEQMINLKEIEVNDVPSTQSEAQEIEPTIHKKKHMTQNLVRESKEKQSHLQQYKNFLLERKAKHEEINRTILNLLNHNKEIAEKINTEYEKVTVIQKDGETLQNMMNGKLESLDNESSTTVELAASEEQNQSYVALEEWNKSCQNEMPDTNIFWSSEKVLRDATVALTVVKREEDETATESANLSQSSLPIMVKLDMIREQTTLSLSCLQSMSESTKDILKKGLLYAVQKQDGCIRSAKVTMKRKKTYLHYLQDGEPPVDAQTIKQSDLIGTLKSDSVVAFMDLAWNGAIKGRIHILISPETPLGRNFRLLCTGDLGPSYAHSRFLQVWNKGHAAFESVKGGDYEHNDGTGGASLVEGINVKEGIYNRRYIEGIVWAIYSESDGPKSAQFAITTGNGFEGGASGVFGHIKKGLSVVRAAVTSGDIRNVTIADCGVVLPL